MLNSYLSGNLIALPKCVDGNAAVGSNFQRLSILRKSYRRITDSYIEQEFSQGMMSLIRHHPHSNLLMSLFGNSCYKDYSAWLSKVNSPVRFLAQCLLRVSPLRVDGHRIRPLEVSSDKCRRCGIRKENMSHLFKCTDPAYSNERQALFRKILNQIDRCKVIVSYKLWLVATNCIKSMFHDFDDPMLRSTLGYYLFKAPTHMNDLEGTGFQELRLWSEMRQVYEILKFHQWFRHKLQWLIYNMWITFLRC